MPDRAPMMCRPMFLPPHLLFHAAAMAIAHNPLNDPLVAATPACREALKILPPADLAAMVNKTWASGSKITVGFMESVQPSLRDRIILYGNRWRNPRNPAWPGANVEFVYSAVDSAVRITLDGDEYYSFIGPDCKLIPAGQHTMMLGRFSLATDEATWLRVVPHEFGHALGFMHEHQRWEYRDLFDDQGTISEFARLYGWPESMTRQQVLTFLRPSEYTASPFDNDASIMRYDYTAACMKSRQPLLGGSDIDKEDYVYAASIYTGLNGGGPVIVQPPPPPPPASSGAVPLALGGAKAVSAAHPARFAVEMPGNGTLRLALRVADQGWGGWLATVLNWTLVFHSAQGRDTTVSLRGGQGNLGIDAGRYEFDVAMPLSLQPGAITAQAWQVAPGMLALAVEPVAARVT